MLIVWATVPPTLSPDTHTNTHSLSLCSPGGVITVPIIIHASQGCSHAHCHLDAHKQPKSHTPLGQGQLQNTKNSSYPTFTPSRRRKLCFFPSLSRQKLSCTLLHSAEECPSERRGVNQAQGHIMVLILKAFLGQKVLFLSISAVTAPVFTQRYIQRLFFCTLLIIVVGFHHEL